MTHAGILTPPAPGLTGELARAAHAVYALEAAAPITVGELRTLSAGAPEGVLASWAEEIATAGGFPLLGTGLVAPTYPALLWNGARLDSARPDLDWAPLLAALAAADAASAGLDRVARAVAAGSCVRSLAAGLLTDDSPAAALPTLATLCAATAAAFAGPAEGEGLERVLDLAASLTVLTPGPERRASSPLWAGHGAASGWLAATLPAEVATPMSGSVAHTLSVAAGHAVPAAGATGTVADLLESIR
ncbi:hypothetical protein ABZU76_11680 [Amycolatopsis sp. NPDC005232]|uniref:hypothetical protein n=1 Tax=Amycolatopsis sp. NPDC005232 TaxID=3157027 RepID=UPI0033A26B53